MIHLVLKTISWSRKCKILVHSYGLFLFRSPAESENIDIDGVGLDEDLRTRVMKNAGVVPKTPVHLKRWDKFYERTVEELILGVFSYIIYFGNLDSFSV